MGPQAAPYPGSLRSPVSSRWGRKRPHTPARFARLFSLDGAASGPLPLGESWLLAGPEMGYGPWMRFAVRSFSASMFVVLVGAGSALVAGAACTPGPTAERPPVLVVPVPSAAPCAPGVHKDGCPEPAPSGQAAAEATCADTAAGPRCEGILAPDEVKTLTAGIDAAQKAIINTQYSDVHAIIDAARLQLRRDADIADPVDASDAARALKNAMRSVAVDSDAAAPRMVLALARARSLAGSKRMLDPTARAGALAIVEIALRTVPAGAGPTQAAAKTLEGYIALERGDRGAAKAAFESATKIDAGLGSAWMGLGDAARSQGDFEGATAAYKAAAVRLPDDAGVRHAFEAASRREVLSLPAVPAITLDVAWGPLAPAAPPVPKCPASVKASSPGAALCTGLSELAKSTKRDDQERGARLILDGWVDLQPLCNNQDPVCGPHVAEALAAASRAFQAAGRISKAVAIGSMILGRPNLPGATALLPTIALEQGDRYLSLGIADMASDFYGRHLQLAGKIKGPVALRSLALTLGLGNVEAAKKLAVALAQDTAAPVADRAAALLATAALVRTAEGPEAAVTWLSPHKALVEQAGKTAALKDLEKPLADRPSGSECASLLACAARRLAGEARWSP